MTATSQQQYTLCPVCAYTVLYADKSSDDYYNIDEDTRARLDAAIDAMGLVAYIGPEDIGEYTCAVDGLRHDGEAEIVERIA